MWCKSFLCTSIGKKVLMAITGLSLCGFLLVHLAGNFLLLTGPEAFNAYSHKLTSMPVIYIAELVLISIFLVHLYLSITLTAENKAARPVGYAVVKNQGGPSRRTIASKSMIYTGIAVAVFLVLHVKSLKFGPWIPTAADEDVRDMFTLVQDNFSHPLIAIAYIAMMVLLGMHLSHAFRSSFQSLGLHHSKYNRAIERIAWGFTLVVAVGFASLPIYFLLDALKRGN